LEGARPRPHRQPPKNSVKRKGRSNFVHHDKQKKRHFQSSTKNDWLADKRIHLTETTRRGPTSPHDPKNAKHPRDLTYTSPRTGDLTLAALGASSGFLPSGHAPQKPGQALNHQAQMGPANCTSPINTEKPESNWPRRGQKWYDFTLTFPKTATFRAGLALSIQSPKILSQALAQTQKGPIPRCFNPRLTAPGFSSRINKRKGKRPLISFAISPVS